MILDKINKPNDIKKVNPEDYDELAEEIRRFLVGKISKSGGHLASNLGVVELTMALHLTFNLPKDKVIWDVGHQSYTHKLLTGRKDKFDELRKYGGMSGFPKRSESAYDAFDTGHSSTSISAGLGYAYSRQLQKKHYHVISVIGDGALTGGMAYEALNNAAKLKDNFIIVLNDNQMSISENVGVISKLLGDFRASESYYDLKAGVLNTLSKFPRGDVLVDKIKKTKNNIKQFLVPRQIFENMGITYLGPVDGHDIKKLIKIFKIAQRIDHAVIVHVITQKGHGYFASEKNPSLFHGVGPFNVKTGKPLITGSALTNTQVFSNKLCALARDNSKIVAITAAMPDGTGLSKFKALYPERFFDVGIAEEHAVTFSAGLAAGGLIPVFAVYSSFLQRAFDQILHDVCIQHLHVILAIDRAGLVGSDGETHQGIFDLSYLSIIPNMTVFAPKNAWELGSVLEFAIMHFCGPFAIRYPRGEAFTGLEGFKQPIDYGKAEVLNWGHKIALMAVGSMVSEADSIRERLNEMGYEITLVNARFIKPIDTKIIDRLAENHDYVITLEENVLCGGYGEKVNSYIQEKEYPLKVLNIALPDEYIEHGSVSILKKETGMDTDSILKKILSFCEK